MTRCPSCEEPLPLAARFCPACGAPIELADDTTMGMGLPLEPLALEALSAGQALLLVLTGPTSGSTILLDADEVSVGRQSDAGVFLDDVTVSRAHASFQREGIHFRIRDLGSLNGTYVNRERVDDSLLEDADEIQIGRFRLAYREAPAG